ncbi:ORF R1 [Macacine gammaherpesvirus 5]|uniref:ORFR1 n=1 Tax=Rhesus monkey rhadinovirus H26-95 TaxID=69256 RepID=Q9J2M8_9GAMA|nr:ORFR1 [Rhesus monkey rhadinovirus H26-95]QFN51601.1 ORF R1 [Macacine gammaherpesvirus 5]QFN51697.1 ORF R1 [Macacine gammaherpesvirus 5]QFN51788.1 R1 [Macacine gammaherpesvirus 5]
MFVLVLFMLLQPVSVELLPAKLTSVPTWCPPHPGDTYLLTCRGTSTARDQRSTQWFRNNTLMRGSNFYGRLVSVTPNATISDRYACQTKTTTRSNNIDFRVSSSRLTLQERCSSYGYTYANNTRVLRCYSGGNVTLRNVVFHLNGTAVINGTTRNIHTFVLTEKTGGTYFCSAFIGNEKFYSQTINVFFTSFTFKPTNDIPNESHFNKTGQIQQTASVQHPENYVVFSVPVFSIGVLTGIAISLIMCWLFTIRCNENSESSTNSYASQTSYIQPSHNQRSNTNECSRHTYRNAHQEESIEELPNQHTSETDSCCQLVLLEVKNVAYDGPQENTINEVMEQYDDVVVENIEQTSYEDNVEHMDYSDTINPNFNYYSGLILEEVDEVFYNELENQYHGLILENLDHNEYNHLNELNMIEQYDWLE